MDRRAEGSAGVTSEKGTRGSVRAVPALAVILVVLAACTSEAPTPTPTATPVPATLTPTPTPTPTPTAVPTGTPSPTAVVPTSTPTSTSTPTITPTPVFDPGPVILPTVAIPTPTITPVPAHPQQELLDTVGRRTSMVRNLFAQREIDREFITRDELTVRFAELFEEDREDILIDGILYEAMGVVDPDTDFYDLLLDVYSEAVLGFYDSDEEKLYVVKDTPEFSPNDLLTYSHEFTHGLQQQYFNIRETRERLEHNHDQSAAFRALIEGDASITDTLYRFNFLDPEEQAAVQEEAASADLEAFESAPHLVQRTLQFPYTEGFSFTVDLLRAVNFEWDVVDKAYEEVPDSTEQILHSEKYFDREVPVAVDLPDIASALGEGWTELRQNTFGEFLLLAYLESSVLPESASLASTGWGGDAYSLLEGPDDQVVLAMLFTWDSESHAQEFFDVFVEFMDNRSDSEWAMVEDEPTNLLMTLPDQSVFINIQGADTLVIFAPDAFAVDAVRTAFEAGS